MPQAILYEFTTLYLADAAAMYVSGATRTLCGAVPRAILYEFTTFYLADAAAMYVSGETRTLCGALPRAILYGIDIFYLLYAAKMRRLDTTTILHAVPLRFPISYRLSTSRAATCMATYPLTRCYPGTSHAALLRRRRVREPTGIDTAAATTAVRRSALMDNGRMVIPNGDVPGDVRNRGDGHHSSKGAPAIVAHRAKRGTLFLAAPRRRRRSRCVRGARRSRRGRALPLEGPGSRGISART